MQIASLKKKDTIIVYILREHGYEVYRLLYDQHEEVKPLHWRWSWRLFGFYPAIIVNKLKT